MEFKRGQKTLDVLNLGKTTERFFKNLMDLKVPEGYVINHIHFPCRDYMKIIFSSTSEFLDRYEDKDFMSLIYHLNLEKYTERSLMGILCPDIPARTRTFYIKDEYKDLIGEFACSNCRKLGGSDNFYLARSLYDFPK